MRKLLILSCALSLLFACKKDTKRPAANYNQAVEGMGFSYNKAYTFYFERSSAAGFTRDSDFVIFRSNGAVTEVSNRFDSGSFVFPDTITYVVNASYDANIYWNLYPNVTLFSMYPLYGNAKGFLLHDYLNTSVVSLFKSSGIGSKTQIKVFPTLKDSVATVTGFIQ
jgi:hypothetical protein